MRVIDQPGVFMLVYIHTNTPLTSSSPPPPLVTQETNCMQLAEMIYGHWVELVQAEPTPLVRSLQLVDTRDLQT